MSQSWRKKYRRFQINSKTKKPGYWEAIWLSWGTTKVAWNGSTKWSSRRIRCCKTWKEKATLAAQSTPNTSNSNKRPSPCSKKTNSWSRKKCRNDGLAKQRRRRNVRKKNPVGSSTPRRCPSTAAWFVGSPLLKYAPFARMQGTA